MWMYTRHMVRLLTHNEYVCILCVHIQIPPIARAICILSGPLRRCVDQSWTLTRHVDFCMGEWAAFFLACLGEGQTSSAINSKSSFAALCLSAHDADETKHRPLSEYFLIDFALFWDRCLWNKVPSQRSQAALGTPSPQTRQSWESIFVIAGPSEIKYHPCKNSVEAFSFQLWLAGGRGLKGGVCVLWDGTLFHKHRSQKKCFWNFWFTALRREPSESSCGWRCPDTYTPRYAPCRYRYPRHRNMFVHTHCHLAQQTSDLS